MTITYGIGLARLVPEGAPRLNVNAVQDLGFLIQEQRGYEGGYLAYELFEPDTRLLGVPTPSPEPLLYEWSGEFGGGAVHDVNAALLAELGAADGRWSSLPSATSLPTPIADILVPSWQSPGKPAWQLLHTVVEPLLYSEPYLGRVLSIGSLTATREAVDEWRAPGGAVSDEERPAVDELLEILSLAERRHLFVTFDL